MASTKASGTFIQGWLGGTYRDTDYQNEFSALVAAGINKVIIQSSVWETTNQTSPPSYSPTTLTAYYPSALPGITHQPIPTGATHSFVESILKNAQANNIKVYLGLNFYQAAWFYDFNRRPFVTDTNWGQLTATRGNQIAQELFNLYHAAYPDAFAGWYWPWEIDNSQALRYPSTIAAMVKMMNTNLNFLANLGGGLPVILSPFYNPVVSSPTDLQTQWTSILAGLQNFGAKGIFAPQDGVGTGNVQVSQLATWFGALKQAVSFQAHPPQFWANCETYQMMGAQPVHAPLLRVFQQFQAVAPSVQDIVTFAYAHYDSPLYASPAVQAAWIQYNINRQMPPPNV